MAAGSQSIETAAPAGRRGLHRQVIDRLAMQIVSGEYPPGGPLPVEAELCETLGVGRSSVREAMRVLTDKGMVEVRPRTGARVLDRTAWRRLDPDLVRWTLANGADHDFLADLVEARRIFEPAAAALAAERATGADLAGIEAALDAMETALPRVGRAGDLEECVNADVAFHKAILAGTGNAVLGEFEVIIEAALRATFKLSAEMSRSYALTIAAHREVYEAIRFRDAGRAHAAMGGLLDVAAEDLGLDPAGPAEPAGTDARRGLGRGHPAGARG